MSNVIESITSEVEEIIGEPEVTVEESGGSSSSSSQGSGFNSIVYNLPEMSGDEVKMNNSKGVVIGCPEIVFSTDVTPLYGNNGDALRSLDFLISQIIVDSNIQRLLSSTIDDMGINERRTEQIKDYVRTGYDAFQSLDLITTIYRNVRLVNAASNLDIEDESFDGNTANLKSMFDSMNLNLDYDTLTAAQVFAAAVYVLYTELTSDQNNF